MSTQIGIGGANIYTADGSLTAARTLTLATFPLTILGTTSSRFFANGNIGIGTISDAGFKLDVNGTARVTGTGSTSATTALTVLNSLGNAIFVARDDQRVGIGTSTPSYPLDVIGTGRIVTFYTQLVLANSNFLDFRSSGGNSLNQIIFQTSGSQNPTSGDTSLVNALSTFAPTTGTATYATLLANPTINQTGGANGISRGLYIAPTLTAAADFRAIETTVGKVCLNTTSGNTMIGTTTDSGYKLHVNGTARIATSLLIGETGNPSGTLVVGRSIAIGYIATVGANQSFRLGGIGETINTNSFLMSNGGYNNQLGNIGVVRYVVGAAPASVGANSVTNLYVIGTETIKLNDGTSTGVNSFYNAGIVTVDLSIMEVSLSGNSNVYVGKFAFRFKRYLINNVGTFTDISAVTNLYNSADAALVGTTLQAIANGTNALDLTVTLPATANTASYRMGANVTITKVNYF